MDRKEVKFELPNYIPPPRVPSSRATQRQRLYQAARVSNLPQYKNIGSRSAARLAMQPGGSKGKNKYATKEEGMAASRAGMAKGRAAMAKRRQFKKDFDSPLLDDYSEVYPRATRMPISSNNAISDANVKSLAKAAGYTRVTDDGRRIITAMMDWEYGQIINFMEDAKEAYNSKTFGEPEHVELFQARHGKALSSYMALPPTHPVRMGRASRAASQRASNRSYVRPLTQSAPTSVKKFFSALRDYMKSYAEVLKVRDLKTGTTVFASGSQLKTQQFTIEVIQDQENQEILKRFSAYATGGQLRPEEMPAIVGQEGAFSVRYAGELPLVKHGRKVAFKPGPSERAALSSYFYSNQNPTFFAGLPTASLKNWKRVNEMKEDDTERKQTTKRRAQELYNAMIKGRKSGDNQAIYLPL